MNAILLRRHNIRTFGKSTIPLLFAYGFGCDQNMWCFIPPAFQTHYQIILFDHAGSGQMIAPAAIGDYQDRHLSNSTLNLLKARELCPHMSVPEETIAATIAYLENERFNYYG